VALSFARLENVRIVYSLRRAGAFRSAGGRAAAALARAEGIVRAAANAFAVPDRSGVFRLLLP